MGAYPRKKSKDEVLEILSKQNVPTSTVMDFNSLPEEIVKNKMEYRLSLVITDIDDVKQNYEFNYYCKGFAKFLLDYKIFTNIAEAINYLKTA